MKLERKNRVVLEKRRPSGVTTECRRCALSGWFCRRMGPYARYQVTDEGRTFDLPSIEMCEILPGAIGALGEEKIDTNTGEVYVMRGR